MIRSNASAMDRRTLMPFQEQSRYTITDTELLCPGTGFDFSRRQLCSRDVSNVRMGVVATSVKFGFCLDQEAQVVKLIHPPAARLISLYLLSRVTKHHVVNYLCKSS